MWPTPVNVRSAASRSMPALPRPSIGWPSSWRQPNSAADVVAALRRRYQPGVHVGTAFAGWIDDLLGRHGLVVFESDDPTLKPLVADLFAHELESRATSTLAREAGDAMQRLGHAPQVVPANESVALFYMDGAGRRAIRVRGQDLAIDDATKSVAELKSEARAHPERFSPNVLLRPLVQDRLLPTACYVAGPAELAYQAQLGGVYREFGIEAPLLYSRASATLLDGGGRTVLRTIRPARSNRCTARTSRSSTSGWPASCPTASNRRLKKPASSSPIAWRR